MGIQENPPKPDPKTQTNPHPIRKDIREKISSSLHQ
jgi:hypothetical protein